MHQELYRAEGDTASHLAFQEPQIASAWAECTMVIEWRLMRPLEISESREWGLQPKGEGKDVHQAGLKGGILPGANQRGG